MSVKQVEMVLAPRAPHYVGDGFRVHNYIPSGYGLTMQRMDPLLCWITLQNILFPQVHISPKVLVYIHIEDLKQ